MYMDNLGLWKSSVCSAEMIFMCQMSPIGNVLWFYTLLILIVICAERVMIVMIVCTCIFFIPIFGKLSNLHVHFADSGSLTSPIWFYT